MYVFCFDACHFHAQAPRKGIPKYHAKFMPVATCVMNYEPIVTVNQEVANAPAPDGLTLDEKIEFVQVRQWGRVAVLAMGVFDLPVVGERSGSFFGIISAR